MKSRTMSGHFTIDESTRGQLAIRNMNDDAKKCYDMEEFGIYGVYNENSTLEYWVTKHYTVFMSRLTFEELEQFLTTWYNENYVE